MRWAAIDFETATRSSASACAVGVALVDDDEIVAEHGWLIRPPGNEYEWFNIKVHGIKPEHTAAKPGFGEIWPLVDELVGDRLMLAHNAPFDMGVLLGSSAHTETAVRDHDFACTVALARRTWPEFGAFNLKAACAGLGIELVNHHDAVADARACAQIAICAARKAGPEAVAAFTTPLFSRVSRVAA